MAKNKILTVWKVNKRRDLASMDRKKVHITAMKW